MTSPFGFTSKTDGVDDHLAAHVNDLQLAADVLAKAPDGTLYNGKFTVTINTNNITVAIKTLDGNNPSASDPVYVSINGTVRALTAALSVTKIAGTNWFNSGATALATKEIDYFVYLMWNTAPATDVVGLGFARIPYGRVWGDFSSTTTAETYFAYDTLPNATDDVVVIGRFAAILSATASFNWSIPAHTSVNLIQQPIFHTRRLSWTPSPTGYSAVPTNTLYEYMIRDRFCTAHVNEGTNGTSNATTITMTSPFTAHNTTNGVWTGFGAGFDNGAALTSTVRMSIAAASGGTISFFPNASGASAWTNVNGKRIAVNEVTYPIG